MHESAPGRQWEGEGVSLLSWRWRRLKLVSYAWICLNAQKVLRGFAVIRLERDYGAQKLPAAIHTHTPNYTCLALMGWLLSAMPTLCHALWWMMYRIFEQQRSSCCRIECAGRKLEHLEPHVRRLLSGSARNNSVKLLNGPRLEQIRLKEVHGGRKSTKKADC